MKKTLLIAATAAFMMTGFMATQAVAGPEGKCKTCHNFTAKKKVGPGLKGVVGRPVASMEGFKYSKSLKANAGKWNWDEDHLRKWMCSSKNAVKEFTGDEHAKTKMPPQKVCDKEKQDKIIAFLKGLG